jgi:AcrR family transcriptional regulator
MVFPSKINAETVRQAAASVVEHQGHEALTLRGVATALGVVPNAIYRYFPSREVLLAAVAEDFIRNLTADIDDRLFSPAALALAPADRVRALFELYMRYVEARPTLYEVITLDFTAALANAPRPLAHELLWQRVIAIVEPLTGPEHAPASAVTLWGLLHGLWALRRARVLTGPKPSEVDSFAIDTFLAGLPSARR